MFAFATFAFLALPFFSAAQLIPTAPGPNEVFKQGAPCTISWTADTSGKWKSTFIELMTGPNSPMIHLTTVANVDGTDPTKTSTAFPCPAVSPNAAIYFYQFTAPGQNVTWTGRFAISDPTGATSAPPNAVQPDGENIPWGPGQLLDPSQASRPPPTAPQGQVDGSLPGAASASGGTILTASAPASTNANASSPPSSTAGPPSSSSSSAAAAASPASSGPSTAAVLATTSALPSSTTANTTASSNSAPASRLLSPPAALVAATLLGLASLY